MIEINQARALAGGVSPGDAPGFPVTLCSGSYRLTSDLVLTGGGFALHVIEVVCDGVTIDLNGFRIQGYGICHGQPGAGCSNGAGPGTGIFANQTLGHGNYVSVHNGSITGMFGNGVLLGREARVRQLAVFRNGGNGVEVADGSHVQDVNASDNAGTGIRSIAGWPLETRVSNVHVERNGGPGLTTGGRVENLVAIENLDIGLLGFYQVEAGMVDGCRVAGTIRHGISAEMARNCTVQGKDAIQAFIAEGNLALGDEVGIHCVVCRGNVVSAQTGIQIMNLPGLPPSAVTDNQVMASTCLLLQASTGYRGNTLTCGSVASGHQPRRQHLRRVALSLREPGCLRAESPRFCCHCRSPGRSLPRTRPARGFHSTRTWSGAG